MWKIVAAIAVVLLLAAGGYHLLNDRSGQAEGSVRYVVTGQANLRDAPNQAAEVKGQLKPGALIWGLPIEGADGEQWISIVGGAPKGAFVWAGNLAQVEERATETESEAAVAPPANVSPDPVMQRYRVRFTCRVGEEQAEFSMCGGRFSEVVVLRDGVKMPLPDDWYQRESLTFDVENSDFEAYARVDMGVSRVTIDVVDDSRRIVASMVTQGRSGNLWTFAQIDSDELADRRPSQPAKPRSTSRPVSQGPAPTSREVQESLRQANEAAAEAESAAREAAAATNWQ